MPRSALLLCIAAVPESASLSCVYKFLYTRLHLAHAGRRNRCRRDVGGYGAVEAAAAGVAVRFGGRLRHGASGATSASGTLAVRDGSQRLLPGVQPPVHPTPPNDGHPRQHPSNTSKLPRYPRHVFPAQGLGRRVPLFVGHVPPCPAGRHRWKLLPGPSVAADWHGAPWPWSGTGSTQIWGHGAQPRGGGREMRKGAGRGHPGADRLLFGGR